MVGHLWPDRIGQLEIFTHIEPGEEALHPQKYNENLIKNSVHPKKKKLFFVYVLEGMNRKVGYGNAIP